MKTEFFSIRDLPSIAEIQRIAKRFRQIDPSAVECILALVRVSGEMMTLSERHFSRYNISMGRFNVMMNLMREQESGLCPSELAYRAGVTRATVTGLLDKLEQEGLIKRYPHPDDRRSTVIRLTTRGRQFLEKILPDHFSRISGLMSHLSKKERKALIALLEKVRAGFGAIQNETSGQKA